MTGDDLDDAARGIDVAAASEGRFSSDIVSLYPVWDDFRDWESAVAKNAGEPIDPALLGNPAPRPSQLFAIGLNYAEHAQEANLVSERGLVPPTFTKYQSCLSGPFDPVPLVGATVDWEVELVAVIGSGGSHIHQSDAWYHIAGVAVGQDYSERTVQFVGAAPQFSLGKSYTGFGPIGPWLVTPDELANRDDLELICEINGEQVQKGRTSEMIWSIPELIATLSSICPLSPGDVVFTGTPSGVGVGRTPPRYLSPGDTVVSRIEGVGVIKQLCIEAPTA